jgi:hypothetical protein
MKINIMKSFLAATLLIHFFSSFMMSATADDAAPVSNSGRFRVAQPILIAKSKDFFLHGINRVARDDFHAKSFGDCTTITYTSRETGKMSLLYGSGNFSHPTVRMSFSANRILGIMCDNRRIYLCVWETGRVFDRLPQNLILDKGNISVMVFRSADGAVMQTLQIRPDKGLSKITAEDKLGVGPLRFTKNGITCFDLAFKFDKELLLLVPNATAPTPEQPFGF